MSSLGWAARHVEGTCLWESAALQKHFPEGVSKRALRGKTRECCPKYPGDGCSCLVCSELSRCTAAIPRGALTSLAFIDAAAFNAPKAKPFFFYCILCVLCFLEPLRGLKIPAKECKASPLHTQRWNPSAPVKETKLFPLMFPVFTSYTVFGIVFSPQHPFTGHSQSGCTCLKFPLFPSFPCVWHSGVFPRALLLLLSLCCSTKTLLRNL